MPHPPTKSYGLCHKLLDPHVLLSFLSSMVTTPKHSLFYEKYQDAHSKYFSCQHKMFKSWRHAHHNIYATVKLDGIFLQPIRYKTEWKKSTISKEQNKRVKMTICSLFLPLFSSHKSILFIFLEL